MEENDLAILYVERDLGYSYSLRRSVKYKGRWYRSFYTVAHYFARKIKGLFFYYGIDGFFEASLSIAGRVKRKSYLEIKHLKKISGFDVVVFHMRSIDTSISGNHDELIRLTRVVEGATCLFINDDMSESLAPDRLLDCFDIVFKSEPFRDISRYNVSEDNKKKIRPTILSCHVIRLYRMSLPSMSRQKYLVEYSKNHKDKDVFFIGAATDGRVNIINHIIESGLKISGGLLPRYDRELPKDLMVKKMSFRSYLRNIKESKINLAIDGHGQFTFRHLELFATKSFVLCSDAINDLWLPFFVEEGKHYITFSDKKDLVKKINYYLANEDERDRIANCGYSSFLKGYNVYSHGRYLRKVFLSIPS